MDVSGQHKESEETCPMGARVGGSAARAVTRLHAGTNVTGKLLSQFIAYEEVEKKSHSPTHLACF